jgi:hypothetical protein
MRKLTIDDDVFRIRDRIVKIYLKIILRLFRRLNQRLLNQGLINGLDEMNVLGLVNSSYEEIIKVTVEALAKIAKDTHDWLSDDDFPADMWLDGFLKEFDPVTHYRFHEEADRKRMRLFESLMSCNNAPERKKQIEIALRYWVRQFEQTADNVVEAVLKKVYQDNSVKFVMWHTMKDAKVCPDCHARN